MVVSKTLHPQSCLKMSLKRILTVARGACSIFCRKNVEVKPEEFFDACYAYTTRVFSFFSFFCVCACFNDAHQDYQELRTVFFKLAMCAVDVACSQQHCSLLSLPLRVLFTWRPGKSTVADCELRASGCVICDRSDAKICAI